MGVCHKFQGWIYHKKCPIRCKTKICQPKTKIRERPRRGWYNMLFYATYLVRLKR